MATHASRTARLRLCRSGSCGRGGGLSRFRLAVSSVGEGLESGLEEDSAVT